MINNIKPGNPSTTAIIYKKAHQGAASVKPSCPVIIIHKPKKRANEARMIRNTPNILRIIVEALFINN